MARTFIIGLMLFVVDILINRKYYVLLTILWPRCLG